MSLAVREVFTGDPREFRDARDLLEDLFRPNPAIYWTDLLLTAAVGWGAFAVCVAVPLSWLCLVPAAVAVLALYRASLFIHEVTHLRPGHVFGFRAAWNALVGYPLLLPSVLYEGVHGDHHRPNTFGTWRDPEYLPLRGKRLAILGTVLLTLVQPALLVLRFLILGPLGLVCPPLQRFLESRGSALTTNALYRRSVSPAEHRRLLRTQCAILLLWGLAAAAAAWGWLPWRTFVVWYVVFTALCLVNEVRGLAVHRYQSEGLPVDRVGQLMDSIDTPGGLWTELWAPVGMRYHALHHLLPGLPYHNLGTAYRRLIDALPPDSVYRASTSPGLFWSLRGLWYNLPEQPPPHDVRPNEPA